MQHGLFQIRVTGILLQAGQILLVKQAVSPSRQWSLPGGRVEDGETLDEAIVREMKEETGLDVCVRRLLYVCDKPDARPALLHITFLLDLLGGAIILPTNAFDENPITDVRLVPLAELADYGFSAHFAALTQSGYPNAGSYMGTKANIGL